MANSDLRIRTKDYALSVIRLFAALPKRTETQILGRQLLGAGTSVGAQYREATRAKSNADFISKIEGSLQELEEAEYWLELVGESGFFPKDGLAAVRKETGELKHENSTQTTSTSLAVWPPNRVESSAEHPAFRDQASCLKPVTHFLSAQIQESGITIERRLAEW
jgi:four helix bundle protein